MIVSGWAGKKDSLSLPFMLLFTLEAEQHPQATCCIELIAKCKFNFLESFVGGATVGKLSQTNDHFHSLGGRRVRCGSFPTSHMSFRKTISKATMSWSNLRVREGRRSEERSNVHCNGETLMHKVKRGWCSFSCFSVCVLSSVGRKTSFEAVAPSVRQQIIANVFVFFACCHCCVIFKFNPSFYPLLRALSLAPLACLSIERFLNLKFIYEGFSGLKHARWKTLPKREREASLCILHNLNFNCN